MRLHHILSAAGAAWLVGGAVVIPGAPAWATYAHLNNGDLVYSSTYSTPCTSPCRTFTAPHPDQTYNLWVVQANMVKPTNNSSSYDPTVTRQLTDTSGNDEAPSYSHDGSKIVFDRDNTGNAGIFEVVASNQPAAEDTTAFGGTYAPGTPAADGAMPLTADSTHADQYPSFAPDNHTIAFVQDLSRIVTTADTTPGGAETVAVTDPSGIAASRPVFDPQDASKLLYVNGLGHIILVTGLETAGQQTFDLSAAAGLTSPYHDEWPDWSPDGNTIAFDSTRPVTSPGTNAHQLWTMTYSITGGAAAVTSPVFVDSGGAPAYTGSQDTQPVWSPDGTQLSWSRTAGSDVDDDMFKVSGGFHIQTAATPVDLTLAPTNSLDVQPNWTGTDASPILPEAPYAALLPGAALLVLGVGLALRRRRALAGAG